jgi:hypothetical protein
MVAHCRIASASSFKGGGVSGWPSRAKSTFDTVYVCPALHEKVIVKAKSSLAWSNFLAFNDLPEGGRLARINHFEASLAVAKSSNTLPS